MRAVAHFFLIAVVWRAHAGDGSILTNFTTPTNLALRITDADSIVVTNWLAGAHGQKSFGFLVSGPKVGTIVKAVSAGRAYSAFEPAPGLFENALEFYKGTNRIEAISFAGDLFQSDRQYRDESGVLEGLEKSLLDQHEAAEQNKYGEEWFSATNKAEAKRWLSVPSNSAVDGTKEKAVRFVAEFYAAGAREVFVGGIQAPAEGPGPVADHLIVVLPRDSEARKKVFAVAERAFDQWWNGLYWDTDVGQKYLFFSFKCGPRHQ